MYRRRATSHSTVGRWCTLAPTNLTEANKYCVRVAPEKCNYFTHQLLCSANEGWPPGSLPLSTRLIASFLLHYVLLALLHALYPLFPLFGYYCTLRHLSSPEIDKFEVSTLRQHDVLGLYYVEVTLRSRWVMPTLCRYSNILTISPT